MNTERTWKCGLSKNINKFFPLQMEQFMGTSKVGDTSPPNPFLILSFRVLDCSPFHSLVHTDFHTAVPCTLKWAALSAIQAAP